MYLRHSDFFFVDILNRCKYNNMMNEMSRTNEVWELGYLQEVVEVMLEKGQQKTIELLS